MNNYPLGTEYDSRAPWNMHKKPEQEVDVTCSNTLSKYVTISVTDYKFDGYDEDGYPCFNYSDCKLTKAYTDKYFTAKEALDLAAEFAKKIYAELDSTKYDDLVKQSIKVFNACEGWYEDELEVVNDI